MIYQIYAIFLLLGIVWFVYYASMTFKIGVPAMILDTSSLRELKQYLKKHKIVENKRFYELGSAFGKVSFMVESLTSQEVIGYELSPIHIFYARLKSRFLQSSVVFKQKDFFKEDLSKAEVLYIWLIPTVSERIWKKIQQECQPGTLLVVFGTPLNNVSPIEIIQLSNKNVNFSIYQV